MDEIFTQLSSIKESLKSFKTRSYLTSHVTRIDKTLKLKGRLDIRTKISVNVHVLNASYGF